ncbi:UTRA domain-containing protein [Vibrio olivae]|uniref:UTRA domain-containing protein n=1 Tax=Vibrio olivae TaxID=1243002 RepID=A0ABV5HRU0_9VIBR
MQYVKIRNAIIEQIDAGMLSSGQKLPPERKLAESFGTTRVTLREALSLLEAEGRIFREDRRGWFISPLPLHFDLSRQVSIEQLAVEQQRAFQVSVGEVKSMLANQQAAELMHLPPFSDVMSIERTHFLDKRPVAFAMHYTRLDRFTNLAAGEWQGALLDIYQQQFSFKPHQIRYRVRPSSLVGDIAQVLRATEGSAALLIERFYCDSDGTVCCVDIEYWRHDAILLQAQADQSP